MRPPDICVRRVRTRPRPAAVLPRVRAPDDGERNPDRVGCPLPGPCFAPIDLMGPRRSDPRSIDEAGSHRLMGAIPDLRHVGEGADVIRWP